MTIRVVLVDDIPEYRRLVRVALTVRGGFEIVGEASDGAAAVAEVSAAQPDIVVLDLGLPDLPGREVIAQIRNASPRSAVVVFTGTYLEDTLGVSGMVDAYVLKDSDLDLLVDLLRDLGSPVAVEPAKVELPRDERSASWARRFVSEQCANWAPAELVDSAHLVVTELVTNAVTHGHSSCELRVARRDGRLRIEVDDRGAGSPDVRMAEEGAENGRGLLLVSVLSAAWGVESLPDGSKRVWADLATDSVDA